MTHPKHADTDHPVHQLIAERWSPYAFADRDVSDEDLQSVFEAARWAASSYNEQPWSYLVARREDDAAFERLWSCLVEGNQAWTKSVPVLAIGCTSRKFSKNGKPNAACEHDLGLASANLTLEATARGLVVHQMIGILPDRARSLFNIPDDAEAKTALAIGYAPPVDAVPEEVRERDLQPRSRKPLQEFVFGDKWGESHTF
ncbi:nitroreductase family protein [Allorhodopirellula solitaria]|uniref:Malonic semialdehyde reductase n=1 Tax=Allorhodopirellula solitaria TaxID=2527987 RepID=A0A5C5YI45_9BACT|nr:nitroreductase family protein [Allorhodopirellula solitaria]TWT74292.1 malonic semialdehyde reductase [Allorhodopirellula solitaria]